MTAHQQRNANLHVSHLHQVEKQELPHLSLAHHTKLNSFDSFDLFKPRRSHVLMAVIDVVVHMLVDVVCMVVDVFAFMSYCCVSKCTPYVYTVCAVSAS